MNDKFEKYLIENEKRIWTPDEFLYELNRDLLYSDLLSEDFLETASEEELLKESLALFGMLGLANKINKTAMDILARKYKFAAISSAMIWMKKTGITTRCNVGGTEIKNSLDKTTKNPKAGDVIFEDFYKALTKERSKNDSPVTIKTIDTNTYSWIVFADANKQQTGNRLEFHIDNDADPMKKRVSELTVRVELKGKEVKAELGKFGSKENGQEGNTQARITDQSEPVKQITDQSTKQITDQSTKQITDQSSESFVNKSFLEFLVEAQEPNNKASSIEIVSTKSRLSLTPFVSLAMPSNDQSGRKFEFNESYYDQCTNAYNGRPDIEQNDAIEDKQLYNAEKKPGKRKSWNKKGSLEECWEVDFYGNVNLQGKAGILSRLVKVLLGGIHGGTDYTSTGLADTIGGRANINSKMTPLTPFKFGFVHGDFIIPPMNIKTMYNFPRLVKKNMEVQGNKITSFAYCPIVKGKLDVTDNRIMSLYGISPSTNREIIVDHNPIIKIADSRQVPRCFVDKEKYLPKSLEYISFMGCSNLEDLEGIPKDVSDEVNLSHSGITYNSLKQLKGLKTERLDISYCEKLVWEKEVSGEEPENKETNQENNGNDDQKLLTNQEPENKLLTKQEEPMKQIQQDKTSNVPARTPNP